MHGEGRTRVGDDILQPTLVHGNHVGIALNHIYPVLLRDGLLCLIESIEFTFLMIDLRVGRVHVFLLNALRTGVEQSPSEGHHLAADVQPGEDDTTSVAVNKKTFPLPLPNREGSSMLIRRILTLRVITPLPIREGLGEGLSLKAESRLHQKLRLIARLLGGRGQGVTLRQGEAEVELRNDIVANATAAEVLLADGDAIGIILQDIFEVFHRPLVDDEHRLTVALFLLFLVGEFFLLYLYIVFLCQPAQGLGIGNLFVLHQEVDGRTTLATGKALTDLLRRRHHERRGLVIVERTQALVVHTRLP